MLGLVVVVILVFLLIGGLPRWGYHHAGYGPSGIIGVLVIIFLILLLTGRV